MHADADSFPHTLLLFKIRSIHQSPRPGVKSWHVCRYAICSLVPAFCVINVSYEWTWALADHMEWINHQ